MSLPQTLLQQLKTAQPPQTTPTWNTSPLAA
uniref:SAM-dependent methyltransferase n=1 Tax=Mesocestoides corti TaxID=53468 RepID=A0A5K3G2W0_MESCO